MKEFWFEDELLPDEALVKQIIDSQVVEAGREGERLTPREVYLMTGVRVRFNRILWWRIPDATAHLPGEFEGGTLYMLQVPIEFVENRDDHAIIEARCRLDILAPGCQRDRKPKALRVYPKLISDGTRQEVTLEIAPEISIHEVASAKLGKIGIKSEIGVIAPSVQGHLNQEGKGPYWLHKQKKFAIEGPRDHWVWIVLPSGCEYMEVSPSAIAKIKNTKLARTPIPLGIFGGEFKHTEKRPWQRIPN